MTHNTFMNCKDWSKSDLELENSSLPLPSDVHVNSYPLPGVCGISKRFYRKRKAFDFLNKTRYILWVVVLPEKCHVNLNGRHLGLGFGRLCSKKKHIMLLAVLIFFRNYAKVMLLSENYALCHRNYAT